METKQEKVRHGSGSSSLDEASCSSSTAGLKGASGETCPCSCPSNCCCAQHENRCCPLSSWPKETSTAGAKKSKGKLWKRANVSRGETKPNEMHRDIDAQLLEQRSTNSSEFDSPSLSSSLHSVADSHCSHFSSELSCSDPETSRPTNPSCSASMDTHAHHHVATLNDATITPMPEVENDRLEHYPSQSSQGAFTHCLLSSSPPASPKEGSSGTFLYISEQSVGNIEDNDPEHEIIKANASSSVHTPVSPARKRCIQTDI